MNHTLFYNLDPAWDFVHWAHHHALDAFARPDIAFWQIEEPGGASPDPWGDWPRRIAPRHLRAELAELHELHRHDAHLWLFNLPALAETPLREAVRELGAALPADRARHRFLLTLPARSDYGDALHDLATATWIDHLVLLPESAEPEQRGYALRLLGALWADPALGAALDGLRRRRVVALELDPIRTDARITDVVAQHWPRLARGLLDSGVRVRGPGLGHGLAAWTDAVNTAARGIDALQNTTGAEDNPPTTDHPLESFHSPWFFDPKLPTRIEQGVVNFYQWLDDTLERRFVQLNTAHQQWRQRQIEQEPAFLAPLQAHTANSIGLSETARGALAEQQVEIDRTRQTLIAEEQTLLARLRGDLTPETRRGADLYGGANRHYQRPPFEEDAAVRQAERTTRTAALGLASRRGFGIGLAWMLALALLPILALRTPAWRAEGWLPYFAQADRWAPDAGWLLLFAGLYLGFGFYQVRRRHRVLRRALHVLKTRADQAHQRHRQALDSTFRYQHLIMAMRRLVLLEEQIERVGDELRAALLDLSRLETVLASQCAYYANRARASDPAGSTDSTDPTAEPTLRDALRERPPRDWLRAVLRDWPADPPETIEVRDADFARAGILRNPYLRGCARLMLTRPAVN